ncbi:hypothetical protein C8J57DRAFT_1350175, partial [Mycena rebaudengoi]
VRASAASLLSFPTVTSSSQFLAIWVAIILASATLRASAARRVLATFEIRALILTSCSAIVAASAALLILWARRLATCAVLAASAAVDMSARRVA